MRHCTVHCRLNDNVAYFSEFVFIYEKKVWRIKATLLELTYYFDFDKLVLGKHDTSGVLLNTPTLPVNCKK